MILSGPNSTCEMIGNKPSRLIWFLLGFLPVVACGIIAGAKAVPAVIPSTFTPLPSPPPIVPATQTPTDTPTAGIPTMTPVPISTPTPATTPTPSIIPDTGWERLQPGLERRIVNLFNDTGSHVEEIYIVRLDPDNYQFDVAYRDQPQTLARWQAETGALIVVNGGYFRVEDEKYIPNGLTVVDGEVIGSSFGDYAGMFAVTPTGPELRWLAQQPYNPDESLLAALQSFPLLVKPGGVAGFPAENEDNKRARRTVIARDRNDRILLLVTSKAYFTLHQLSVYLANSDFDLDIAINLDGGKSSGIILARPSESLASISPLPVVIAVYER